MKSNKLFLMVLVLIVVVLAACSPAASTFVGPPISEQAQAPTQSSLAAPTEMPMAMPTEKPLAAPDAAASNFPTGRFVSMKDKAVAYQFNADGTFGFYFAAKDPVLVGNYSVKDNLVTMLDPTEIDPNCQGAVPYQWNFDGEQLTFKHVGDDPCKPRRDANADTYMQETSAIPEVKIDAVDFSYTAPDTIRAGWVRVILTNSGAEPHHVQFLRLNDGVTFEQFQEALKQGEGPALALVKQMGGVGAVAPTLSAQSVLNLTPGEYVILCLIASPGDHTPHMAKGMIKSLTVQPATGATANEPTADLTVRLKDYTFDLPETLPAGPLTIKVINDGPEPHEFNIMRLADDKTADDVVQYLEAPDGPPPFTPVGGMNGLDVGSFSYVEIDLQSGTYVAICNIPSPKAEGHPHFMLGMVKEFTASPGSARFPTGKFISVSDKAQGYQFNEDGSFAYYLGGVDPVVQGNYTVVGDLLSVINPTETDAKCQGSVTYHWSFDGQKLTFAPFGEDACRARRDSFSDTYIKSN